MLPALRLMPYDRLVLLAGRAALRSAGFRRLRAIEPGLRAVPVDPFDFLDCLSTARAAFRDALRSGDTVRASVSGGTKVLADATILAAFQEGVEAWYCDPDPIRLPVLRGVRIEDALSPADRVVARLLSRSLGSEDLVRLGRERGMPRSTVLASLHALRDLGLASVRLESGKAVVAPTPALAAYRAHLARSGGKA